MEAGIHVGQLNFISRWVLFAVATWKLYRDRERAWIFFVLAFGIDAITPESYIIRHLGIILDPKLSNIMVIVSAFLVGGNTLLGALHLRKDYLRLSELIMGSVIVYLSYFWLLLVGGKKISSFTLQTLFPLWFYSLGLIYAAIVFYRISLRRDMTFILFPAGMFLLGALNLTYPFTRNLEWFLPYAFGSAAVFRFLMAVGLTKFVLFPKIVSKPVPRESAKPVINLFKSYEDLLKALPSIKKRNGIYVTRTSPQTLKQFMNKNSIVFWITRAKEGRIDKELNIFGFSPTKIDILIDLITRELEAGYDVVVLDAFEYIALENGFNAAMKFLLDLKDRVSYTKNSLLIILDPGSLTKEQLALIEREFKWWKEES